MTAVAQTPDLSSIGIFAGLDPASLAAIAARLETLTIARGAVLVRQGETSPALYLVLSGRFSVTRDVRAQAITEIGPDQPIGEIGFLTGAPRTATVTAIRDSLVLKLDRAEFDALAREHPAIWPAMTATIATRLAATTSAAAPPPDPRPRTIAIIAAGAAPVPDDFIQRLGRAFSRHARTLVLDSAKARSFAETDACLASSETTRRLNAFEREFDYVLFVADATLTAWSEKVIRHADLVLAAGRATAEAHVNPLEHFAAGLLPADARRLILLHETRTRLSGSARWLTGRSPQMHHHVALDTGRDIERLYRFLSGTAKGLVACGGGAFCAAHIGVFKALEEHGIEFDIMGGTSGGAAMTAAFLLSGNPAEMDAVLHDMFVTNHAMRRYTLPWYSLIDHTNFDAQLKRHFGGPDIEDLWLPFFAVSTNLSRYTRHTHRTGPLWRAIRASASIPVLLPPVYTEGGEMLADGCLLDNVPIRGMHDLKSGPNVVVSFDLPQLERFDVDYDRLPGRSELVRRALNPLARRASPGAPGVPAVLMRALMANRHDFSRHLAPEDLLLVPTFPADMGLVDWHRHTEMVERAYAWTDAELRRLKSDGGHAVFGGT